MNIARKIEMNRRHEIVAIAAHRITYWVYTKFETTKQSTILHSP